MSKKFETHETEFGISILADCMDYMATMADKSVDLVLTDPPYNIDKVRDWDKWKTKDAYIDWCGKWINAVSPKIKDNGSFYVFHNDMPQIAMLMEWIRVNTPLVFKQMIVWNKRFEGSPNKGYMDGYCAVENLRNYKLMAEYCLFYTFQDQTGLTTVMLDTNNFTTLRQYFKDYQEALGLTKKQILEKIGQSADHCFRWGSTQWDLPTPETYAEIGKLPLKNEFIRKEYEDLRKEYEDLRKEYEDLRKEYEDLRYTFNNQKTHHSVWNYDFAPKQGHITPKPVELIENIIRHSSNEGATILDPFAGSFTTAIACIRTGRKYICIEKERKYFDIGVKRIEAELEQTDFLR
jgi:site-specific DNA-methyltransferase (adenine-specific)